MAFGEDLWAKERENISPADLSPPEQQATQKVIEWLTQKNDANTFVDDEARHLATQKLKQSLDTAAWQV